MFSSLIYKGLVCPKAYVVPPVVSLSSIQMIFPYKPYFACVHKLSCLQQNIKALNWGVRKKESFVVWFRKGKVPSQVSQSVTGFPIKVSK